jgi:hypothetical protein
MLGVHEARALGSARRLVASDKRGDSLAPTLTTRLDGAANGYW